MAERDVVLAKAATIDRCIVRVGEVRSRPKGTLLPIDVEDIVILNLTRAVQAAADLAAHVAVAEGFGLPDSLAAGFTLLEKHGVIEPELSARLRRSIGFRNVAVHAYDTVNAGVIDAIATRHVEDLRRFAAIVVARYADK
jgi:uncharacterized protein YutE (UPF0331/DUF86 family)